VKSRAPVVLVALLAVACSPELDWRELKSAEGGFVAMMPGKPLYEERTLAGTPALAMHLWSARAADSLFGIGYADYPVLDEGTLDGIRDALIKNLGGHLLEERSLLSAGFTGREFAAASASRMLRVRLLVRGRRLYQLAVLGDENAISAAKIEPFFSSFQARAPQIAK
jgi:hypothetical protein